MSIRATLIALALTLTSGGVAQAHCEVPCGIYGDAMRIASLREDVATIEKAMQQIGELAGKADAQSVNQCVRWITTKEEHAQKVQHVVWQYFMTQRIKMKPGDEAATKKATHELLLLHGMLQAAMKTKQTVDAAHCAKLRELIDAFAASYLSEQDRKHLEEHHKK